MVLCECTKQLDLRWMEELSQHKMTFASGKMGPEVWGLPVGGVRGWSPGYSKTSRWKFTSHPMHEDRVVHYAKNFKTVDPALFMADSDTEISLYQDHVNKKGAQIPPHPKGKRFRRRDLLSVGNRSRLENHEEITGSLRHQYSVRPHSVDPSVNRPQFYDIMQNPTHHQSPTGKIPRPLRGSLIWCEAQERMVTPKELWASQGACMYICTYMMYMCVCVWAHRVFLAVAFQHMISAIMKTKKAYLSSCQRRTGRTWCRGCTRFPSCRTGTCITHRKREILDVCLV